MGKSALAACPRTPCWPPRMTNRRSPGVGDPWRIDVFAAGSRLMRRTRKELSAQDRHGAALKLLERARRVFARHGEDMATAWIDHNRANS